MSKRYKIKWRESDYQEIKKVVKNFNAKLARVKKKIHPDYAAALPDKITAKQIIDYVEYRQDLKLLLNRYKRFSKRGNEEIVKSKRGGMITKWGENELRIGDRIRNHYREKEKARFDKLEVMVSGIGQNANRLQMGKVKDIALSPLSTKIENKSQKEIEKAFMAMDSEIFLKARMERKEATKAQYIKGMETIGYSQELIDLVQQMPADLVVDTVVLDENAQFAFMYDKVLKAEHEEGLYEAWLTAFNNYKSGGK